MEIDNDEEIVDNFSSDIEGELNHINNEENDIADSIYNPNIYNFDFIYSYFKDKTILKSSIRCPVCNNLMSVNKDKSFIGGICFRCSKVNPKHDIKYSIRKYSIFENVKIKLVVLYFIIYE